MYPNPGPYGSAGSKPAKWSSRFCLAQDLLQIVGPFSCPDIGPKAWETVPRPNFWAQNWDRKNYINCMMHKKKWGPIFGPDSRASIWAKIWVHNVGPRICSSTVRAQCFAPFSEPKSGLENGTAKLLIFEDDGFENAEQLSDLNCVLFSSILRAFP